MSTAFHPQTDGQTERLNQTIEAYLRAFVNYEQNNWTEVLPMAEFAYNNSTTSATNMSPFYANYGYNPRATGPGISTVTHPASKVYHHWMKSIFEDCTKALHKTRENMSRYADSRRLDPPKLKVGDKMMLDARNLRTRRPSRKLDHKLLGPFIIEKIISPTAVRLTLPQRWKIHNVFHISLLEPYHSNSKDRTPVETDDILRNADDLETDTEPEIFQVERIMDSSWDRAKKRVMYLVKWKGYPEKKHWTNEPYENLSITEGALDEVRRYHREHPKAAKDHRLTN